MVTVVEFFGPPSSGKTFFAGQAAMVWSGADTSFSVCGPGLRKEVTFRLRRLAFISLTIFPLVARRNDKILRHLRSLSERPLTPRVRRQAHYLANFITWSVRRGKIFVWLDQGFLQLVLSSPGLLVLKDPGDTATTFLKLLGLDTNAVRSVVATTVTVPEKRVDGVVSFGEKKISLVGQRSHVTSHDDRFAAVILNGVDESPDQFVGLPPFGGIEDSGLERKVFGQ